jgi:SAM-dependent methyltransferase
VGGEGVSLDEAHEARKARAYEQGGFNYDPVKMTKWLAEYCPFLLEGEGRTLLDAGCGDGFWTRILRDWGWECTGVDVSRTGVRVAREKDPLSTYIRANLFERRFGPHHTVFIRTVPFFSVPVDDGYRSRMRHLWSVAAKQLVYILYSRPPYNVPMEDRPHMQFMDPDDVHEVVLELGGITERTDTERYFIWKVER